MLHSRWTFCLIYCAKLAHPFWRMAKISIARQKSVRPSVIFLDTILKLLELAGKRCERLMLEKVKAIPVQDVEVDEIWGFVFKKEGHKWDHEKAITEMGDAYCFIGMERSTKTRPGVSFGQEGPAFHGSIYRQTALCNF